MSIVPPSGPSGQEAGDARDRAGHCFTWRAVRCCGCETLDDCAILSGTPRPGRLLEHPGHNPRCCRWCFSWTRPPAPDYDDPFYGAGALTAVA